MQICDKCKKRETNKTIKLEGKIYDLCNECYQKLKSWLKQEDKGFFGNLIR